MDKDGEYWRDYALWLSSVTCASSFDALKSRASKSMKLRHLSILEKVRMALDGGFSGERIPKLEWVKDRVNDDIVMLQENIAKRGTEGRGE